jgi:hypothetical protein
MLTTSTLYSGYLQRLPVPSVHSQSSYTGTNNYSIPRPSRAMPCTCVACNPQQDIRLLQHAISTMGCRGTAAPAKHSQLPLATLTFFSH